MVDSPTISLCFPSGLKPLASGLPQTQRASIPREAQGLGRESSQRFWTFGPECGPGPGQGRPRSVRAAAGSKDPTRIDSTWHIPPGQVNASWDSLSSPGLCMPLGRKWARRIGAGKIGKVTVSFQCPPFTCYFSMDPNKQRAAKCMPVVLNVSSLQRSRIAKPWLCVARDKPRLGSQGPRSPRYLVPAQQRRRGH